jgi:molybdopterin/thiamine biosynthesis adenylyltransferase
VEALSLAGGFVAWQAAGLPVVMPPEAAAHGFGADELQRYSRHLRLPEVGLAGQEKLRRARVLCIGAGGLGSPAALYLAAAGIGTLGLVDGDRVELSNLQRQVLHTTARVGALKTDSAAATLTALNPAITVIPMAVRLAPDNAESLMAGYDVVVDGSDNFATRYLVSDMALKLGQPVVHAAIQGFEGQLAVFPAGGRPCYRCLFPAPPPPGAAPSCDELGVLGVLPGVLGVLQATEAVKLVLGIGTPLAGRLLLFDALEMRFTELAVAPDPACGCRTPGGEPNGGL